MIILQAILEKVATRKDKTLSITLGTNELSPSEAAELMTSSQSFVYVAIKKDEFRSIETNAIEQADLDFPERKSQCQRLRGVMFKLWEQDGEGFKDFDAYYKHHTERIIAHYKTKIDS